METKYRLYREKQKKQVQPTQAVRTDEAQKSDVRIEKVRWDELSTLRREHTAELGRHTSLSHGSARNTELPVPNTVVQDGGFCVYSSVADFPRF